MGGESVNDDQNAGVGPHAAAELHTEVHLQSGPNFLCNSPNPQHGMSSPFSTPNRINTNTTNASRRSSGRSIIEQQHSSQVKNLLMKITVRTINSTCHSDQIPMLQF